MKSGPDSPEIRGWCPGALRPMQSGDGLVVRIRPREGRLTQDQAQGIAKLSARFGNGQMDLSARANVQIRGVSDTTHGPLIDGLASLGLIDPSAGAEARRNIIVSPFWRAGDGTFDLATRLASALADDDAPRTPGKFGYAIDTGPCPVLRDASADIRLERDAEGQLLVRADGATHGLRVSEGSAPAVALDLARWFLDTGGAPLGRGRMAAHLRKVVLPERFATHSAAAPTAPTPGPRPGPGPNGVLVGLEFGQLRAETLSDLALIGPIRVTPWRMLLIEGATQAPDLPGLITRPDDPMLAVIACTGAPGCPQGRAATRSLARALAAFVPAGHTLHVSGCAKGCAHPGPAPLTLVATAPDSFDLVRCGSAADPPLHRDLRTETLIRTPALLTE